MKAEGKKHDKVLNSAGGSFCSLSSQTGPGVQNFLSIVQGPVAHIELVQISAGGQNWSCSYWPDWDMVLSQVQLVQIQWTSCPFGPAAKSKMV